MTSAIRRKQFDPETLRTYGHPPPREPRKWYDWPLFICGAIVAWSTILAVAVAGWNSAPMLVTILALVAVTGLVAAGVAVYIRMAGISDEPETMSRDMAAMEYAGTQRMILHLTVAKGTIQKALAE